MNKNEIIVIDDDQDDGAIIHQACKELNICNDVKIFTSSKNAFDYILTLTKKPFFILCDINMPVINGLELRKKINEVERLRLIAIPFLFWSTAGNESLVKEAYSLHIQGFFKKPDSLIEVKTMVETIMTYWDYVDSPS